MAKVITTKDFVSNSIKVHGNKYDYSKVEYVNAKTKVCIICPEHGEFWQTPNAHLCGQGCPECGKKKLSSLKMKDVSSFIDQANIVHDKKYIYSKVEYNGDKKKVCIICPEHGEFWQLPSAHLRGQGCPECGKTNRYDKLRLSLYEFIKQCDEVHNGKYDYSKVEYVNTNTKVCIICPEHGEFWQRPLLHIKGYGCKKCSNELKSSKCKLTKEEFIKKSKIIHGDKYDYSKVIYIDSHSNVDVICPIHGIFSQSPNSHLNGSGCPKCAHGQKKDKLSSNTNDFIEKSQIIHKNYYIYDKVNYVNNHTTVNIICPIHGVFEQLPFNHLRGQGCPKCGQIVSKAEDSIMELLNTINPQQRNRDILNGKEIDIYIPSLKLGIEYNGLHWHSEKFGKDKDYHLNKLNECNEKGIRLIQIFEDEWIIHREICESKLKHICGLEQDKPKVFARRCLVQEISNNKAKEFLNKNHIQGFASSTVYLGCFYNEELIGVMSFKREKDGYWDLNRFATDINYNCIGVGGKLFKHFVSHYDFIEIKSFADRRWTINPTDNLYTKLGFKFAEFTRLDYRYYKDGNEQRFHKFGFRKQFLHKKYGLPLTMTEYEMTQELGYYRIWDCGLIKYIFTKNGRK